MNKSLLFRKAIFIFGFLFLFINISSLNGIYNLYYRFIITGLITFPFTYFLIKINPFKRWGIVLLFAYFIIATPTIFYGIFNNNKIPGIISYSIYIIASAFAILASKSNKKILISIIYFTVFFIGVYNHDNLMNIYYDLTEKNTIVNKKIPAIELHDADGKPFSIKANGKIQIIDFWSNSCSYCIKAFPKYEELYQNYKNDSEVIVYSVNVKLNKFDIDRANKYVEKYNFKNYFTDVNTLKKLNFSAFPYYMVIAKNGTIKYFGTLNSAKAESYNNIYKLITSSLTKFPSLPFILLSFWLFSCDR